MKNEKTTKRVTPAAQTLEVPKIVNVRIDSGILICGEDKNSDVAMLFAHIQNAMNDKNNLPAFRALAAAHGFQVEVSDD